VKDDDAAAIGSSLVQPSAHQDASHDRVVGWMFVLVQLALLAAVFLLPDGSDWTTPAWLLGAGRALSILGLVVVGVGLLNLGPSATPLPMPVRDGELRSNGLYRYVRHPIYSGVMALAVGSAIPSGSVWVAAAASALVVWLTIKVRWEERRLHTRYAGYAGYASRTPRFIPSWRRPRPR
jgi:protein-S-isoprenylcysteine O-methyltransferase Ste14